MVSRPTEQILISNDGGTTVTRLQQVREPTDCDKSTTFHAMPCHREDRNCDACKREGEEILQKENARHKKERDEKERKRQIPIDLSPLPDLKGSQLLDKLLTQKDNRWDEIKQIEAQKSCTRHEAADEYDRRHNIDRTKELTLIPSTIGHYGGDYVDFLPEQEEIIKKVFGNLYPRKKMADSVYFRSGVKGRLLLSELDGIIYNLDYPEYWD